MGTRSRSGPDQPFDLMDVAEGYKDSVKEVRKMLKRYTRSPTSEDVHDTRIAIRKLRVSTGLLPSKVLRKRRMARYERCLRELFKLSSRLRDLDVLMKELGGRASGPEFGDAVERLSRRRERLARKSARIADQLKAMKRPRIDVRLLRRPEITSRFRKKEARLLAEVHDRFAEMVSTDDNVKPLHEMRKAVKKLRYSLQLLPRRGPTDKLLGSLQELQDVLGRIHDRDVLIGYLHGMHRTARVTAAIETETRKRAEEFREFIDRYGHSRLPDQAFPEGHGAKARRA